jgi:ABC-type cobalamin/Fe3+-siderophores transport system ATPase subunit
VSDAPQHLRAIIRNSDSNYARARPPAVVNAKDVCDPSDLSSPSHSCWFKVSEISLRALRMAFLDPQSRVRLASDPPHGEHAQIEAVRWQGGFLDELSVSLSEDLSVLIGGPGAGKSTVIESLRYALDIPPTGEDAKADHEGIVRHVLRSGTTVSVLVHYPHPSPADYVIERTVPNPPVVRSAATGEALDLRLEDLVPRAEIYGQHEIAEIAGDSQRRTRLLERFRAVEPARARRLEGLAHELGESRSEILKVDKRLARNEERLAALPGIEATLKRYREAGVEERLKEQSRLVLEEQLFTDAREEIGAFAELVEAVREELPLARLPQPEASRDGQHAFALARDLGVVLKELETSVTKPLEALDAALANASRSVDRIESSWHGRKQEVEKKVGAALRRLQREHIDGQEFITLRRELEKLRPLRQECETLTTHRKRLVEDRRKLLVEREGLLAADLRDLERAAKAVTKRLGTRVRVAVEPQADRTPLLELISSATSGRMKETLEALHAAEQLSVRDLAERIRAGSAALAQQYGVSAGQAERLAAIGEETVMRIEEIAFATETTIELNLAQLGDTPRWRRLEHLSKGQKATAILLLVLLESEGPLIVDQPEDDLDNTFISGDVVPTVRREKPRRQFIFATHNANIPVLADAELIIGLSATGEAAGGRAEILDGHLGSIDIESVRTLVEERLEGGHDAFELRRQKYGI